MEMRTALLDADIINYMAAASAQRDYGTEVFADINRAIEDAEAMIYGQMEQADCNQVILVYSPRSGNNWRKLVMPLYKHSRKATPKPVCYGALRDELEKRYDHISIDWLEADDILGPLSAKIPNSVVVSADKDLHTVPDIDYLRPHTMAFPQYNSEDYANWFWMWQTIAGDPTDSYKGIVGCGPKKADSTLAPFMKIGIDADGQQTHDFDFDGAWEAVKQLYREKGQTNWLEQSQMARILRVGDYCSKTKRIRLFNPEMEEYLQLPKD